MQKLKILDLFSGLGGFSLGLERTGRYKTVAFCEIDKYCTLLLQKHWKGIKVYNDVKKITKEGFEADGIESPDIITGGFPCQPFSVAGKQKGTSDDRHLWPEMFRIIKAFKPRFVIGENVPGIVNIQDGVVFETVCTDLESQGYEVQPFNIPAAAVGAPHQRKRIWIIASLENSGRTLQQGSSIREKNEDEVGKENANQHQRSSSSSESNVANADTRLSDGQKKELQSRGQASISSREGENVANAKSISSDGREIGQHSEESREKRKIGIEVGGVSSDRQKLANTDSERLEGLGQSRSQFNETSSSTSCSEERQGQVGQGWWEFEPNVGRVAHGVPGRVHRLKALGNSIVPQIAEEIGRAIIKAADDA
jgi:DNA (cytosine-5)-methyltransferase 1